MTTTLPTRFWAKTAPATDCILWTGAVNNKGYGCYAVNGVSHLAHRVAWEAAQGPIPDELTIDHLCRVRNCVNVEHMELVTAAENLRRARAHLQVGGECRHGHKIARSTDLYLHPATGVPECRACRSIARWRHRSVAR